MFVNHYTLQSCLTAAAVCTLTLITPLASATPTANETESGRAGHDIASMFPGPALPWSIAQASDRESSPLMASIERVASRSSNPAQTRRSLLLGMRMSTMCYAPNLSPEEMDALVAATGLLPAAWPDFQDRFNLDSTVWAGDGGQASSGLSTRARLTYSFPPDLAIWGDRPDTFFSLPNSLNSTLISVFGFQDIGREWIRQALAAWKHAAGVELDEVGDSGIPLDRVTSRRSTVGDIRIGGNAFIQVNGGTNLAGVLAYNFFPNSGGDMCIDTNEFTASNFNDASNNYRFFRNTLAHEHGHGLGFIHQVPCDQTKLMEPFLSTAYDVLQVDEKRGAAAAYGDRFSGNFNAANAATLGTFSIPIQPARLVRDLSVARQNGSAVVAADWFKFTINSVQSVTVLMVPAGGTYTTGPQSSECNGTASSVNASNAIDLELELRDTNGTSVLASSTNGAGQSEGVTQFLNPGTYFIRVASFLADPGANVQLYNLQVGITGSLWIPEANAGLNKRINVAEFCQFMGDVNTVPGVFPIDSYQWDLDGNGSLETVNPRPATFYFTPGIRRVRLVVVDSAGGNSNDFINVTVIGNAPTVSSVSPTSGNAGTTVPITISGSSLGSPTVTVSGTGVTVSGSPNVDLANPGAPITGLSFVIDGAAAPGPRNVTVTTPSGATTLSNAFTVIQPSTTISSISPSSGTPGQTVPITINGSNFNGVTGVTIDGTGATLTGTFAVNPARTQITGLSVQIAANASTGPRSIRVAAGGGNPTSTFTVNPSAPTNDLCTNPVVLSLGNTINGTNVGAGTEGAVSSNCASGSTSDVFYAFTPTCTASYRFETGPSTFDTVLSVHDACPAIAANIVACDDDIVSGSNLASRVDTNLTAGSTYLVRVASFGSRPQGAFTLTLTPTAPLANDVCTGAANLPVGQTLFDNCAAESEPTAFFSCIGTGKDLWYTYTADRSAQTTIETCGSSFDTVLEVFNSACGTATPAIACIDDFCDTQSRVTFVAQSGTTYRVRVSGFGSGNAAFGTGTLTRYCPADINLSGSVTVQDIFDFLASWFAGAQAGDFNGASGATVQDIFDFLAAWFAGC